MNERIQELIQKAGFPEWSNKTIGFELETFAKLIIEECCDICYDVGESTTNRCAWEIEKRFGVK
jgi:uncharacterized protein YutE (UPF0331/DUF86 family)